MSQILNLYFLACLLWGLLAVADLTTDDVGPRAIYTCTVPANNNGTDDSPAILAAFKECRKGRRIVFSNTTYHVNQMMTNSDLEDTQIEIHGTLLVESPTSSHLHGLCAADKQLKVEQRHRLLVKPPSTDWFPEWLRSLVPRRQECHRRWFRLWNFGRQWPSLASGLAAARLTAMSLMSVLGTT